MAKQHLVLVFLVASILHATTSVATTSANSSFTAATTVYYILGQNNLPRGLLPLGVQSYVLHDGGALEVTLPGECNFLVPVTSKQFKFRYGSNIAGVIKSGSITRVSGIRMQVEFTWLGFNKISRSGDILNIQLETSTQTFPVSAFSESPRCG